MASEQPGFPFSVQTETFWIMNYEKNSRKLKLTTAENRTTDLPLCGQAFSETTSFRCKGQSLLFLMWNSMTNLTLAFALNITSVNLSDNATLMLTYSLCSDHPGASLIYLYPKIVSRPLCAQMLFTNLCAVAPVPLTMGKHSIISWYAAESTWEVTSWGKWDTKPLLMISLFSLKQRILLIYLFMRVF